MKDITNDTYYKLNKRGIDLLPIVERNHGHRISHEEVISLLRRDYGIIVDIRYANKDPMLPPWFGFVFKENSTTQWERVSKQTDSYEEMADYAIQTAIKYIPQK